MAAFQCNHENSVAKPDMLSMMTNRPTVLYDGSPAFKDYSTSKRNRYNHLQAALKNHILFHILLFDLILYIIICSTYTNIDALVYFP